MKLSINFLINNLMKLLIISSMIKKMKEIQQKNEFLSREIGKKAISGYGMIISATLQHILKIYSDDGLE